MPEILPKDTVKPGNCRDTYQMPMFTRMFCDQWIEEAEYADNWFSSGEILLHFFKKLKYECHQDKSYKITLGKFD